MYSDCDQNGFIELFVFTEKNDSIYINWLEPLNEQPWAPTEMAVCKINKVKNNCDYVVYNGDFSDLNGDGKMEIIFMVNNKYGLSPRSLYAVDIYNRSIIKSPTSFASLWGNVYVMDLDGDGEDEITYRNSATANVNEDSVPYSDHSAWLSFEFQISSNRICRTY